VSLRFREKIQALLWWSDNSLRVELRMVQTPASLRKSQLPYTPSLGSWQRQIRQKIQHVRLRFRR
jgi:hypothetical protein